jgi:WD40 repeat protein
VGLAVVGSCDPLHKLRKSLQSLSLNPRSNVFNMTYSVEGAQVLVSCDHTISFWDGISGKAREMHAMRHSGGVFSVALSPDGNQIVSGSFDKTIRLWNV